MTKLSLSISAIKEDISIDSASQMKERVDAGYKIFEKNFATWGNLIHVCIYKKAWNCLDYLLRENKEKTIEFLKETTERRTSGFEMLLTSFSGAISDEFLVFIINKLLTMNIFSLENVKVKLSENSAIYHHPVLIALKHSQIELAKRYIDLGCPFDIKHENLGYLLSRLSPPKKTLDFLEGMGFSIKDISNPNSLFSSAVRQGSWDVAQLISDKCENLDWKKEDDYNSTLSDCLFMRERPQEFTEFVSRFGKFMSTKNKYKKHFLISAIYYHLPHVAEVTEKAFPLERSEILGNFLKIHGKDSSIKDLTHMLSLYHWNFTDDEVYSFTLPQERTTVESNYLHWAAEDKNKSFKGIAIEQIRRGNPRDYLSAIKSPKSLETYLSITDTDIMTLMALTDRQSIQSKLLHAMI